MPYFPANGPVPHRDSPDGQDADDREVTLRAFLADSGGPWPNPGPARADSASAGSPGRTERRAARRTRHLTPALARTLACRVEEPPEDREARFRRLEDIRDWLLAAAGGCPVTRDLLLDLDWGQVTMTEAARVTGWSVSTVSRKVRTAINRIRLIARLAAAADGLFSTRTGFTLDPATAAPVGPVAAWAVSLGHLGLRLPGRPTRDELVQFLAGRIDALLLGRGRRRYFGGWVDVAGGFWLDVTVLIPGREAALAFARKNRQHAITHLGSGEEVLLSYRETRRAA